VRVATKVHQPAAHSRRPRSRSAETRKVTMEKTGVLRVLTLNCWNVCEPLEERMAIIRRGLAALNPDVAGFQEVVVRCDGLDQGSLLLGEADYFRVFGPAFRWNDEGTILAHDGDGSAFGNLIASRWPILHSEVRPLPGKDGEEPRSVLGALIDSPAGVLSLLTTHLDWQFDHGWMRERQVRAIDIFARDLAKRCRFPPILTGDFNAHPGSTEMRFLRGLASLDGSRTYFQDAWEVAGPGGSGFTWDNRNPFAAHAHEPDRRIDYILVGPADASGRGRVEAAWLAFEEPVGDLFASDHFGVLAEVRR
jgi:endonuclease/exonuclease/phosphatase family metal-dependent hydrolase